MDIQEKIVIMNKKYPIVGCDYDKLAKELGYKNEKTLGTIARKYNVPLRNTVFKIYEDEEFKSIAIESLSHYKISNYGRIITNKNKLLKVHKHHQTNYLQVSLVKNDGKKIGKLVHILVYITFKGEIPKGLQCDHINNKRDDPSLKNLSLLTPSENVRRQTKRKGTTYLNTQQVKNICKLLEEGYSISKIMATNSIYTKSKVEKIKQRIRHVKIGKKYNF